jgi:uncharacterized protein YggU (UPF0235/DUF167 family)
MEFYIKVEVSSDNFSLEKGSMLRVGLTEPAENGRANAQLIREMSDILDVKPAIVSGHRSCRKKLKVDTTEEEFENKIEDFLGD